MEKENILRQFELDFPPSSVSSYGQGHINRTYLVETSGNERYILQGINKTVFPRPEELMENIVKVTLYLKDMIEKSGGNPDRETLTLVPALDGKSFFKDEEGEYYRVYRFIEDAVTLNAVGQLTDFYESGIAFGRFQSMLRDFPAETLHCVIPDFHNTAKRFLALEKAVELDTCGRKEEVKKEIDFIWERRQEMSLLADMQKAGALPLRVTHNDTKLNNVMLDKKSHKALCVIDLDTVMPGSALYDFGDALRMGGSAAAEDETDLDKVRFEAAAFEAFARGYLSEMKDALTETEIALLPLSVKLMTYESGVRFLTDYLNGDTYFKIHREHHNLDRARNQFKLVADIASKEALLAEAVRRVVDTAVQAEGV